MYTNLSLILFFQLFFPALSCFTFTSFPFLTSPTLFFLIGSQRFKVCLVLLLPQCLIKVEFNPKQQRQISGSFSKTCFKGPHPVTFFRQFPLLVNCCFFTMVPGESEVVSIHARQAFRGSRGIAPPILKLGLRGLSPRANYTDRAAAAGRRS